MKIKACLTNKSDLWKTPKKIYDHFTKKLKFFDPCPSNPTFNGLKIEWEKNNFVNPPYSQIKKWIDKAIEEKIKGHYSVLLLPARTDTQWFKKLLDKGAKIYLLEGRLHLNDSKSAPFPSMIAIFNARTLIPIFSQILFLNKTEFWWNEP
jgi:site-specific DNA-methyltransferase (adenine-specific)